jgi:4-phospho-D-threonate 3-dehydrogenase / 4-phospho-D-erythronate 3-dehydrogenase
MSKRARIGITMGDPAGIGPEIILKALAQPQPFFEHCLPVVLGDARVLARTQAALGLADVTVHTLDDLDAAQGQPGVIDLLDLHNADPDAFAAGTVSGIAGQAAVEYIIKGTELALQGDLAAIVTAPINKESINLGGYHYAGHTELLADLTQATDVSMMLVSSQLRVLHVSTHVALAEAIRRVQPDRVLKVIRFADQACRMLGIRAPRVAVAGLNPHAGEHGLFGREDIEAITPAIEAARAQGLDASGPWPGDTVFLQAVHGKFDVVVAMYHDQGHIPMKLLGFDEGVNVSIGLPIIRTSVDHGTAFDIVGQGIARATSLIAALDVAVQMVAARR